MLPDAANKPDQVLRTADDALYESKSQGRNRATVYHLENPLHVTTTLRAIAV
jgi:predicted signal transduction protein with EAL and GGDEF domain